MKPYFALLWILVASACTRTADRATALFSEQHRPQFHFSPPSQWMNDPNGMVYYEGEYHLFYQHYPDSNVWGPMHWGHAVSKDLVTWEHLPIALYPDSLGYIFSGSAVVDWHNTSRFGKNGEPPLVAIFTYHDMEGEQAGRTDFQYQGIAYSNDKGRTWTKYEGNPVVPNTESLRDFRDPKVFWHADSKQWIMVFAAGDRVRLYQSPDLKAWTFASEFGAGYGAAGALPWECPDLFPLTVEGTDEQKWVLLLSIGTGGKTTGPNGGSATQYFVGNFDGKTFTTDNPPATTLWVDYGRDNYAGVTWADVPATDGRRLFMGWMSNWQYATVVPTTAWRSAMTLPRVLTLRQTAQGLRLVSNPVAEVEAIRHLPNEPIDQINPSRMEALLTFNIAEGSQATVGIQLANTKGETYRVGYNAATRQYFSDRTHAGNTQFSPAFANAMHTAPRLTTGNTVTMRCFFDVSSAELFADEGLTAITDIFFPNEDFTTATIFIENGNDATLTSETYYRINRIWE